MSKITTIKRYIYKRIYRLGLKNKNFSVIASNCNGGVIMSDLGVKFRTPTVNVGFKPGDFLLFLSDIEGYLNCELKEFKDETKTYPVGDLNGIKLYFVHYDSFDEAYEKWQRRKDRINYDNLFIIFTDRDGCTYEHIKQFDMLPYKNKVIFTNKHYPEFKSAYYIEGFEEEESVGVLTNYIGNSCKRFLYKFDFVKWFNSNIT